MVTKTPTTRSRSTSARPAARKRTTSATKRAASASTTARVQSLADDAKTAVRSVRTRAKRAAKKVPTDTTSLSIAAGVIAGIVAAGVAIFMNRDRLRDVASTSGETLRRAATTGGERLKKAADDLSAMAHDQIDQARDNITKFRARADGTSSEVSNSQIADPKTIAS